MQTVSQEQDVNDMDALVRSFSSLSDLVSSPSVLSSETSLLTSELTSLCHSSHSTFLLLHDTSTVLQASLDTLSTSLRSLLSTIPSLHKSTQHFTESTKPILETRRKAGLILEQQEKLVDLLEIPTLIDTCARNGMYQDAMELWTHAGGLLQQFKEDASTPTRIGILRSLEKEIDGSVRLVLGGLIEKLKGQAKLPVLHRMVGFLREMGGWREEELAILFLCCRGAYIETSHAINEAANAGTGKGEAREDVSKYLRGYIEVFREGVYDVVTAFTVIFIDHAPNASSPDLLQELRHLLSTFTEAYVSALLDVLFSRLPSIKDFTSLSSLLTPLTYCGTAFSRIGLDFSPLLSAPFEQAVLLNIKHTFEEATMMFVETIAQNGAANVNPSTWLVANTDSTSHEGCVSLPLIPDTLETELATVTHFPPPQILTFSPLLASFLNAQLGIFNSLRLIPILALLPSIYSLLCKSLSTSMTSLLEYARNISSPTSPTLRMSFERHRKSTSVEMKSSEGLSSTGRPVSPGLQRASTPSSVRPYSPSPRQVFAGETAIPRHEQETAVVLAVGKAHARILIPFLRKGLLDGVYRGVHLKDETKVAAELEASISEWESWFEEQAPKPVNGANSGDTE